MFVIFLVMFGISSAVQRVDALGTRVADSMDRVVALLTTLGREMAKISAVQQEAHESASRVESRFGPLLDQIVVLVEKAVACGLKAVDNMDGCSWNGESHVVDTVQCMDDVFVTTSVNSLPKKRKAPATPKRGDKEVARMRVTKKKTPPAPFSSPVAHPFCQ